MLGSIRATFACCIAVAIAGSSALAQPSARAVDAAVEKGLTFVATQQRPNGSFDAAGPPSAISSIALLAFLSAGHAPETGKHGLVVKNTLDHLLSLPAPDGYFGKDAPGHGMYAHAVATLALAQVYGLEKDSRQRDRVRAALDKSVSVLYTAQDIKKPQAHQGGWRYEPNSSDSDLSVTGWCMLALLAAQDAGLDIPRDRIDRASAFVLRCHKPQVGGFAYQPDAEPTPTMTASALLNLYLSNQSQLPNLANAHKFLTQRLVRPESPHYYSALLFTTLAAYQSGDAPDQPVWSPLWNHVSTQLLTSQRAEDGSWTKSRDEATGSGPPARVYSTAMACLTLSTPAAVLPLHRR